MNNKSPKHSPTPPNTYNSAKTYPMREERIHDPKILKTNTNILQSNNNSGPPKTNWKNPTRPDWKIPTLSNYTSFGGKKSRKRRTRKSKKYGKHRKQNKKTFRFF